MQENMAEAERRIEEARSTQAKSLDLGDLELSELPASLGELVHLKALCLGIFKPTEAGVLKETWDVELGLGRTSSKFTDLGPLAGLEGLQSLDLSITGITDLAPLVGLQGLQNLYLSNTSITGLAPLAGLQGLQILYLSFTGITDLAPLAELQELQSLDLSFTGITDLAPLAELQELQSLDLSFTGITDFAPLAGLQGLQHLSLLGCQAAIIPAALLKVFADHSRLAELFANKAVGVPQEILSRNADNCLPRLRTYFSELALSSEAENEIKVILLGNKPEELLTLEGTTMARSALDGRVLDLQKNPVSAAPFSAFFEGREHESTEGRTMDITPPPLTVGKKPREVFISYAWGDDSPEGKVRTQVVDELQSALAAEGLLPVRDRDQIRPGEPISAFIRRLTRANLVVAVISDKYLRSFYCMYEIYRLWQKCQGDADDLLQRLVPIVLPEVRVGNVRERLPYLEHWADQADSLEALIRNPKLRPSAESWEEVRLVREFAHHVDGILVFLQDVLMPRKLEAHLDDGFQTVREALRRRLAAR